MHKQAGDSGPGQEVHNGWQNLTKTKNIHNLPKSMVGKDQVFRAWACMYSLPLPLSFLERVNGRLFMQTHD